MLVLIKLLISLPVRVHFINSCKCTFRIMKKYILRLYGWYTAHVLHTYIQTCMGFQHIFWLQTADFNNTNADIGYVHHSNIAKFRAKTSRCICTHPPPPSIKKSIFHFFFFTASFNLYGVLFHVLGMSRTQVILNTATHLKHILIKSSAPPGIWSGYSPEFGYKIFHLITDYSLCISKLNLNLIN